MTELQRHLFPIPAIIEYKITPTQRQVLDWVAFNEGRTTSWPIKWARKTLRTLIAKRLVKVTGHSPGRYMLTGFGRAARARRDGQARENVEAATTGRVGRDASAQSDQTLRR